MKSLGIDIGSNSIRVVEVNSNSKGYSVNQIYEHKLSYNPTQDTDLEIIDFLREVFSKYDPTTTQFNFALRQDRVAVRNKTFPFTDRIKIHKSLPFELEDEIPFSLDNSIFDAKLIRAVGPTTDVLACAAPHQHIESIIQKAKDCGVDCSTISAEGIAFANIFENFRSEIPSFPPALPQLEEEPKPERNFKIILNIGHTRTLFCVFENESLISVRSLLWGGKNIIEAISKKYELPIKEAQKELESKGFILLSKSQASFDQVTFSELISRNIRDLVRDLQIAILDVKSEFNGNINSIEITGGVSQIKNLNGFLTQNLDIPVNRVSVFDKFSYSLFQVNQHIDTTFGIALGLALDGLRKPRNPGVNFLKGEFAVENKSLKLFWNRWGRTVQLGASLLVIAFIYSNLRDSFALQLAEKSKETLKSQAMHVAHLSKKQANEANVKKYIKTHKKRASEMKAVARVIQMNSALDLLKKINDATPAKTNITLDIKKFKVEEDQVSIEGYVLNPQEASLLQSSLKGISLDGQILEGKSNLPQNGQKKSFSFNFKMDRGIEKVAQ